MLSIPLHDDEVLTSYLSRWSYAHGLYRMRTFCRDIGLDVAKLKIGDAAELAKLARLSDIPVKRLRASAVVTARAKPVHLKGHVFLPTTLKREYLRFCPHCLVDDLATPSPYPGSQTYYRAIWFFPQVTSCIKHEREIIEIDHPGQLESLSHDFCAILGNLVDGLGPLQALSRERQATDFEKYVARRLNGERSPYPFLDALPLEAAIYMSERFGTATVYGRKATARKLEKEAIVLAREAGFNELKRGRKGAVAVLDRLAASSGAGAYSAHGCYGELYMALHKSFRGPDYDVFRDIIREHAATQNVIAGTSLFGAAVENDLVRLRDVASELGVPSTLARSTLKRRGKAPDMGIVSLDAKQQIANHLETLWTWAQAREHLGFDLTTQRKLHEAGILKSGPEYRHGTCDGRQVMSLEKRIRELVTSEHAEGLVSIWDAVRPAESNVAEVVQTVLDGKLKTVAMVDGQPVLQGLRVSAAEIRASFFPVGTITMSQAGERLHLTSSGISMLLQAGGLKAQKLPFPRDKWWAVDLEDTERFAEEFITLLECRNVSKRSQNWLSANAKKQGLAPAFSTAQVGQAIYPRRLARDIMTDCRSQPAPSST